MAYVDGFVLPLSKKNVETYREVARKCDAIWRERRPRSRGCRMPGLRHKD